MERKPTLRGKWENAFSGREMDNVPKETHVVSPMILYLGTGARIRKEKANRLLLHLIQRQRLTGKNPSTGRVAEVRALGQKGADSRAEMKMVISRHVITGILPYVRVTSQKQDAVMATSAAQQRLKKCGRKGSVELLKESIQLGCVSQEPRPRKSILWKEGALRSNHAVNFSKGTWHQTKIRERKGPSREIIQRCEPHERSLCTPKFEEVTRGILAPRRVVRKEKLLYWRSVYSVE